MIPAFNVPYDYQNNSLQMAEAYYQLGETDKADAIMKALADKSVEYAVWYMSLDDDRFLVSAQEYQYHLTLLNTEIDVMKKYESKLAETYEEKLGEQYHLYMERMGYQE